MAHAIIPISTTMNHKTLTLLLLTALLSLQQAKAADFVISGLTYRVLSATERTVEVVRNDTLPYGGAVSVPGTVQHGGQRYTVTRIGDGAFLCCTQLQRIALPATVRHIAERAFYGCSQLAQADIGQQTDSIGHYAFSHCTMLSDLHLPATLKHIGRAAFKGCSGLQHIQAESATPPTLTGSGLLDSFAGTDHSSIVVTVPEGSAARYHAAPGWSQFAHITDLTATTGQVLLSLAIEGSGHVVHADGEMASGHTYTLPKGEPLELMLEPEKDYTLQQVYVNGQEHTELLHSDTLTLPALTANTAVRAVFAQRDTYLTLCHDENGSLQIDVVENRPVRLHIRPNAGWRIHRVTVDGDDVTEQLDADQTLMIEKARRGMAIRVILEKNGQYAVWSADGLMTLREAGGTIEVPEEAVCADLTSCPDAEIRPNSNPNTLYVLSRTAAVPAPLADRNVVVDGHADRLTLTDGHDIFVPFDLEADEALYTRTPTLGTDGHGGWDSILLPFGVEEVTDVEAGEQIAWRQGPDDYGHRFWLRRFAGTDGTGGLLFADAATWEANEPYLLAVPADTWGDFYDLRGKPLQFAARHTTVRATPAMCRTWYPYTLHGTLHRHTVSGYVLNAAGDAFVLTPAGTVNAFRCHLTTDDAAGPALVPIHTDTTGITTVATASGETAPGTTYHINGTRLPHGSQPPHGIYIVNGQKTAQ